MTTCPHMRAALAPKLLVSESDTGRLYRVGEIEGRNPLELLDELAECTTTCQFYSTCIPTGEGFTTGCTLAPLDHYRA